MRIRTAFAAAVILAAGAADAAEGWKEKLAEAKALAKASEHLKAAGAFGDALAEVQKAGDLVAEQEVADAFFEFLERVPRPRGTSTGSTTTVAGPRDAKAAVMARLDPARSGAFVSAPCLAGELLLDAIRAGDGLFVAEAAAVLEQHEKGIKSGAGLKVLAILARGLKEVAAGEQKAAATLAEVRDASMRQHWTDLALAAGVELAALPAKKGDAAKAKAAVVALAKLVSPKVDRRHLSWCSDALRDRLKDLPAEVQKPFADAVGPILQQGEPGMAGGKGGAAVDSENPVSPLGLAHGRTEAGRPLASVARTDKGFEFRVEWDPAFRASRAREPGVGYLDEGGLAVALSNWSVGLALVDLVGNRAGPPGQPVPPPGQAFYRLAPEETWTLTKDGLVQVSAK